MKILVVNAGSSSLKYQLIDMDGEKVLAKGICERIGIDGKIEHKTADGKKYVEEINMPDHTTAFKCVEKALTTGDTKVIDSMSEIDAVGHRIVQGGAIFSKSVLVDDKVIADIDGLADLAPLHNKAHVQGINACIECLGKDVPEVVVFDTSFHQTMPERAYMFGIPYEYYENYKIRRYGFHGTSHRYVSAKAIEELNLPANSKVITCHLGNGSSLAAVVDGKCVDTTMGLTPLDGFVMGTRSGSLDPSVVTFIAEKEHLTPDEISKILNKESGLLGVSGVSSDDRDVSAAEADGNLRAHLAHEMLYYQIAQYIGSYYVALGGCDGIVFTAGLGENQPQLREKVCDYLACLGVKLDKEFNAKAMRGVTGTLSAPDSKIRVELVATDEEMVIARDTKAIVETL